MKAANLLISNEGVLMIADFGLARSIHKAEVGRVSRLQTLSYADCPLTPCAPGLHKLRRHALVPPARAPPRREEVPHPRRHVGRWVSSNTSLRSGTLLTTLSLYSCVIAEMFHRTPIFPGSSDMNQAEQIFT